MEAFWSNNILQNSDKESLAMIRYAIESTSSLYGSVMAIWMFYFIHEKYNFDNHEPFVPICFTSTLYLNEKCNLFLNLSVNKG